MKHEAGEKKDGQLHLAGLIKAEWSRSQSPDQDNNKAYTVTIFCASSMGTDPDFAKDAAFVGSMIGENNWRLVYGGGDFGLMGVVSQAVLDNGGVIKGVITDEFNQGDSYPQKEYEVSTADIFERKKMMMKEADAYIVLAGGFGTLDELAEAGCEQYLGTYKTPPAPAKPIILINRGGLYDNYKKQLEDMVAAGLANEKVMDMFTFVENGKEAIEVLQKMREGEARYFPCIGNVDHRRFK